MFLNIFSNKIACVYQREDGRRKRRKWSCGVVSKKKRGVSLAFFGVWVCGKLSKKKVLTS